MKEALTACAQDFPDADRAAPVRGLGRARRADPPGRAGRRVRRRQHEAARGAGARRASSSSRSTFATNQLVLAVPADGAKVDSLEALERPGVKLVIGAEGVPVGDYTRAVLERLGAGAQRGRARQRALQRARREGRSSASSPRAPPTPASSTPPTSRRAAASCARSSCPAELEPTATYGAGVVEAAKQPDAAEAFVDDLLAGGCHDALLAAGFGEP